MPSSYPAGLDNFNATKADGTLTGSGNHANHHNDLALAVNAIEAELGTTPSGSGYPTVAARFDGIASVEELQDSVIWPRSIDAKIEVPVMVAKFDLKIVAASLVHYGVPPSGNGSIAADNTDYWRVDIARVRAGGTPAIIAQKTTRTTSSGGIPNEAVADQADWNFNTATFSTTNQDCIPGDVVIFNFEAFGAPVDWGGAANTFNRLALTVRYEPL